MKFTVTKNIFFGVVSSIVIFASFGMFVSAQTPSETPASSSATTKTEQVKNLQEEIGRLEAKVSELRSQGKTLTSQIDAMDSQIQLTEARMNATKQEITELTLDIDSANKRMQHLEGSLDEVSKTLINRIVATYQIGGTEPLQVLLLSDDVSDLASRANYLRLVQAHDKQLLYDMQQARNDYASQKLIFEDKKKKIEALKVQLEEYNLQLEKDKKTKEELLTLTKNDETKYQSLLDQARRQIASFKSFATSQGGASILPPQPSPDGWYYNQRDERWGRNLIGNSSDQVWEVGCLITSVTMVLKKHGENVTPADVAAISDYFVPTTASMRLPWGGGRFSSTWGYNQSAIDSKLAGGEPVIVGVKVNTNSVGTHFLVLKSGSNGNYIMNDPWNGPDLDFSSHYSTGQIFQYGWLN